MEDKVLIKSEIDKKAKNFMIAIVSACFSLAVILFLLLLPEETTRLGTVYPKLWHAFHGNGLYLAQFIIAIVAFVLGIISLIIFVIHNNCELIVTEKNVRGKAILGKDVVLPIYMISAYSTKSFLSTIAIASSSGLIKFSFIENCSQIGNVLSQLINQRQEQTKNVSRDSTTTSTNMDDLVKLKNLLEQGIITQEEFDAKKKQLLGL